MFIVITGTTSGLGLALAYELLDDGHFVLGLDISDRDDNIHRMACDVSSDASVKAAATEISKGGPIDILINNAGINYINWLEFTEEKSWDMVMDTNAKGIYLTAKYFMPMLLPNKGTILNIVSNASHMPMTNSIAYNASKGAAHIMTLQLARELGPKGVTVFGISPNKIAGTGMSKYIDDTVCELRGWTPEEARSYQLKSLPAGEETDATTLAEFVAFLLSTKQRHKYLAGTIIPYGK